MNRTLWLAVCFILAVAGASAQTKDTIYNADYIVSVFKLKGNTFFPKKGLLPFGFKPGATIQEIKAVMGKAEVFKEDSSYVTYTIYFSKDKYDFADITFDFAGGKATDVSVETYFGKKAAGVKTLNLIKVALDKLYKPGEYANKKLKWKYARPEGNLWIQLSEIEFEGDYGFVLDYFTSEPEETDPREIMTDNGAA